MKQNQAKELFKNTDKKKFYISNNVFFYYKEHLHNKCLAV